MKLRKILEKTYLNTSEGYTKIKEYLENEEKKIVVTLNPEGIMQALNDEELYNVYMDENTILYCESVGVKWAIKKCLKQNLEYIPGIELFEKLIKETKNNDMSVYLYGATEEVITKFSDILKQDGVNLKGFRNGYNLENKEEFFEKIKSEDPDLIAFALGVGKQEKELYELSKKTNKGIFIGVGGSFDVLSGTKKRAPKMVRKLKIEWLYRILKEPSRIKRFLNNNVKFAFLVLKEKRK